MHGSNPVDRVDRPWDRPVGRSVDRCILIGFPRGPCGPSVDRPVDRSVDRCILIGFVPWTVNLFLKNKINF